MLFVSEREVREDSNGDLLWSHAQLPVDDSSFLYSSKNSLFSAYINENDHAKLLTAKNQPTRSGIFQWKYWAFSNNVLNYPNFLFREGRAGGASR